MTNLGHLLALVCYDMNTGFSFLDASAYPYLFRAGSYNQTSNVQNLRDTKFLILAY